MNTISSLRCMTQDMSAELTAIRRSLTTVVEKICRLWLALKGYHTEFAVVWDDINLQDELECAKAEWYRQQAREISLRCDGMEREAGE